MYHHIGDCPPEQQDHRGLFVSVDSFRRQLTWLRDHGYQSVTLDAVADHLAGGRPLPRRWIVISFDDGFRNNFTAGFPLLQELGFSAVIFLITDRVARAAPTGKWDDYLILDDIHAMREAGIQFGSHTHTHPRLTKLDDAAVLKELEMSRHRMTDELGLSGDWFCYPYGNFSPRIAAHVQATGYRGALSTIRDNRVAPSQIYGMPRVMVMDDTTPGRLAYRLSSAYHWLHIWKNRRRWKSLR